MHSITLDTDLQTKLHGLTHQVEVLDENGLKVGYFLPRDVYRALIVAWSEAVLPEVEIERRLAEPGEDKSLTEFWQSLRQTK